NINKDGPLPEYAPELGRCWIWTGTLWDGYGTMAINRRSQPGSYTAHRLIYQFLRGPIPNGMTLDHLCRVRNCVRPDHLEPVTLRENLIRGQGLAGHNSRK